MPDPKEDKPDLSSPAPLADWVAAALADGSRFPEGPAPLREADEEGLLPWLGWRLQVSGTLGALPPAQEDELRNALRHWGLMHLDCDAELERLARTAAGAGIRFLAFKGHSVARTLYPHPACRPTSDFDLLIDPQQVSKAQDWLHALGYEPLQRFVGIHWLGAQSWSSDAAGNARFHVDLHWDYSNRMYFRNRLPFEALWTASQTVPCGHSELRVPCPVDDLVLACVHLAAFKPAMPIRSIWLLDVYLLMAALGGSEMAVLLQRAADARAIEACLEFGERAAELGDRAAVAPVLAALEDAASESRRTAFERTRRSRAWDLTRFWWRLPLREKAAFFGDMARWVRGRS